MKFLGAIGIRTRNSCLDFGGDQLWILPDNIDDLHFLENFFIFWMRLLGYKNDTEMLKLASCKQVYPHCIHSWLTNDLSLFLYNKMSLSVDASMVWSPQQRYELLECFPAVSVCVSYETYMINCTVSFDEIFVGDQSLCLFFIFEHKKL